MPSAIAPAVVLEPANAALLAAKIAGIWDGEIRARVIAFQKEQADRIIHDDNSFLASSE
jgi:5-(carboxyamino)imidazole ribonucleotide mutase/phosphoribosylaminoimidazole-succinocarboxamide synthase